jgi:hypothetical protein
LCVAKKEGAEHILIVYSDLMMTLKVEESSWCAVSRTGSPEKAEGVSETLSAVAMEEFYSVSLNKVPDCFQNWEGLKTRRVGVDGCSRLLHIPVDEEKKDNE